MVSEPDGRVTPVFSGEFEGKKHALINFLVYCFRVGTRWLYMMMIGYYILTVIVYIGMFDIRHSLDLCNAPIFRAGPSFRLG